MTNRKVVLAYSGGLDTSVILVWLRKTMNLEVITYTADIGQVDDHEAIRSKALEHGAQKAIVEDLREPFVRDFIFPMLRANTVYEGRYLLGTSIARPLIGRRQAQIADQEKAVAVSHGATGKGNDQVRFELAYYATNPNIEVIAPWREWDLTSRDQLIAFAEQHQIAIPHDKRGEAPFSIDDNLLHVSAEGKVLEDPTAIAPEFVYTFTNDPQKAPNTPQHIIIGFECGDPVSLDGQPLSPMNLMNQLNELASLHGVGREDIIENRFVGMKSRGVYETPAGTVLLQAHRAMESATLDREIMHLKDDLMPRYARMIYNGFWWSPERLALQALIDTSQQNVSGTVTVELFKGRCAPIAVDAPQSLFDSTLSSFNEAGDYNQQDASGFIRLQALRLRTYARRFGPIGQ